MKDEEKLYDSNGVEIKHGDIIHTPNQPELYHAAYDDGDGLEIRDLWNNNIGMWQLSTPAINIGPYWRNLHLEHGPNNPIISDEDLDHYWDTTREEALKKLKEGEK